MLAQRLATLPLLTCLQRKGVPMSGAKTTIDLDMPLSVLMTLWPATIPVFLRYNTLCVGCLVGPFHTVADTCNEHGIDKLELVAALEQAMRQSQAPH